MGMPISSVGGASGPALATATSTEAPSKSAAPTKVAGATGGGATAPAPAPAAGSGDTPAPAPSPVTTEPKRFWPPAYGWRLSALGGERASHNGWQSKWLEQGSAIAGGGAVDSVAALKPKLRPHLQH